MKEQLVLFLASLIRTVVPAIVGQVAGFFVAIGLPLEDDGKAALGLFLGLVLTTIYYSLIRLIEQKLPNFGWLLGFNKSPDSYSKGDATTDTTQDKIIPGTTLPHLAQHLALPVEEDGPAHRA